MTKNRWVNYSFVAMAAILFCSALGLAGQRNSSEHGLNCDDSNMNDRLVSHCEMKEETINAGGTLSVDGKQNGGVSIKGWDQQNILVRYRVQTGALTESDARAMVNEISVRTGGNQIYADGPSNSRERQWSVSYEIFVPRHSDVSLKAHNGGISVADVQGKIEFETYNGGVSLSSLAGSVHGRTTNGAFRSIWSVIDGMATESM